MTAVTNAKIARLSRALFPRYGIQNIASLVATISKYRNGAGYVAIFRPDGGWSWFAAPGATVATPSRVTLNFPADYRRDAKAAREDLYRKLEDVTLDVMSEDEMEALISAATGRRHHTKKSVAQIERELDLWLRDNC